MPVKTFYTIRHKETKKFLCGSKVSLKTSKSVTEFTGLKNIERFLFKLKETLRRNDQLEEEYDKIKINRDFIDLLENRNNWEIIKNKLEIVETICGEVSVPDISLYDAIWNQIKANSQWVNSHDVRFLISNSINFKFGIIINDTAYVHYTAFSISTKTKSEDTGLLLTTFCKENKIDYKQQYHCFAFKDKEDILPFVLTHSDKLNWIMIDLEELKRNV